MESNLAVFFLLVASFFLIGEPSLSRIGGLTALFEEAGGLLPLSENRVFDTLLLFVFYRLFLLASGDCALEESNLTLGGFYIYVILMLLAFESFFEPVTTFLFFSLPVGLLLRL